jgi:hypothetical protein
MSPSPTTPTGMDFGSTDEFMTGLILRMKKKIKVKKKNAA